MDTQLLSARICDALRLRDTTDMFKSVGFLSESERDFVSLLGELSGEKYAFWGGYEDAQRVFFIALPNWCDDIAQTGIVQGITFTYRECDRLTHRDFLGTLMALGITRECVGDILCEEGRTVVFVADSVADYVISQIDKVGGVGVCAQGGFSLPLPQTSVLKEGSATIASLRLDSVVAALLCTSREKAKEIILDKRVSVNGAVIDKITYEPNNTAKISVRGVGRFILSETSTVTKKGRIILKYLKYV